MNNSTHSNPNPAFGAHLMAYAGIPTFMRRPASRDLEDIDVAIVGIPFDSGAASWRSGTRFGPRKIRENSLQIWGHNRVLKASPLETLNVGDYGDIAVDPTNINTTVDQIVAEVSAIIAADTQVISLGGDHSITYPLLKAHAAKYGPLAVVHFDSHTDTYRFDHVQHATPFYFGLAEGLIDKEAYIQVGIRGPVEEPNEIEDAEAQGARVLTIEQCFDMEVPAIIEAIHAHVGNRPVYVSLDIDAIDPAYAPGTGTPEVGGFTSYQMLQLVRGLRGLNTVGFDLVEVSPAYDHGDVTSILAANLVFEFLSLLALQREGA
ncbi:MAG: agmatinase [Chloroflexota bacterium]